MNKSISARITLAALGLLLALVAVVLWIGPARLKASGVTVYNLYANPLAQLTGTPGASANVVTETATMTLMPFQPAGSAATGNSDFNLVTEVSGANSIAATSTITAGAAGSFGQLWIITLLSNAAGDASGVTYTFATPLFKPTATVAVSAGKSLSVVWISDGTAWREIARSSSAQ
jgi:hypothetical protein